MGSGFRAIYICVGATGITPVVILWSGNTLMNGHQQQDEVVISPTVINSKINGKGSHFKTSQLSCIVAYVLDDHYQVQEHWLLSFRGKQKLRRSAIFPAALHLS